MMPWSWYEEFKNQERANDIWGIILTTCVVVALVIQNGL